MSVNTNTIEINQGEDKVLSLRIKDELLDPVDLTTITGIEATFKGTSTDVVKTLGVGITIESTTLGKIKIAFDEIDTAALKVGNNQDFKIKLIFNTTDIKIKKVAKAINVIDPNC